MTTILQNETKLQKKQTPAGRGKEQKNKTTKCPLIYHAPKVIKQNKIT